MCAVRARRWPWRALWGVRFLRARSGPAAAAGPVALGFAACVASPRQLSVVLAVVGAAPLGTCALCGAADRPLSPPLCMNAGVMAAVAVLALPSGASDGSFGRDGLPFAVHVVHSAPLGFPGNLPRPPRCR